MVTFNTYLYNVNPIYQLFYFAERYGILFAPVKHDMQGNVDVSITSY